MITSRERFKAHYPHLDYDVLVDALVSGLTGNDLERERIAKLNKIKTDRSEGKNTELVY